MKKVMLVILFILPFSVSAQMLSEDEAAQIIDSIYKGDYREAFATKDPELFLKHIPDDFTSVQVDGQTFNAEALRQFFPTRFTNQVRLIEHNVTIEDIDILPDNIISAIVTLYTLEEFSKPDGGTYFVTAIGTYRDDWQERDGVWYEIKGTQLRNQTITSPRP
jgi:ketosteroid isomerase-like protein